MRPCELSVGNYNILELIKVPSKFINQMNILSCFEFKGQGLMFVICFFHKKKLFRKIIVFCFIWQSGSVEGSSPTSGSDRRCRRGPDPQQAPVSPPSPFDYFVSGLGELLHRCPPSFPPCSARSSSQ